jgi:iron-compound ABC transporter, iron-compound-binding protein
MHLKDSAKERIDALAQIFGKQAEAEADKLKAEINASFEAAKAADSSIKEKGNHDQPVTFEYIKKTNPDWLFVLNRSAAIGEEDKAAKDVLDNPLVAETTAWKKGQVVYLPPETYLAAGGTQELLNVSKQVTEAFNAAE